MNVTIITGGSDGIGAEMARQLAVRHKSAIALVLAARNAGKLEAVAAQCRAQGSEVLCIPMDVSDETQCRDLVARSVERFGRIDTLVNNAGMSAQALFEDVQDLRWYEDLMRVNLWGSVWCTHAALPHVKAARGRIVAVSSLSGLLGVPGRTAYAATKFAMTGFFEALRAELRQAGVSVTIAYPGVVTTHLRHRGYNARGEPAGFSGLKEDDAMSVEECARLIVDGMERRERDIVMTAKGKIGRFLKLLAPGVVDRMALAALKQEARPH
ncbi:MAG TPA: SDR family oxidoreductase [Ramlibacter sp.]|uniref:SDR family oxidoreductase n=1 Tax=Ramlibacter sp. TaxID=1917967 RepID=UPI002ED022FF